ncbi:MAG: RNA polymerase sigma factor [Planctomycetota bacterium]
MNDTEKLVEAATRGDDIAIDELLNRYLPGLRAFIRLRSGRMLRAKESASDLAQSVCREVLQHMDRFQYGGESGFKSWLYTTALRKIANRQAFYQAARRDARREISGGPGDDEQRKTELLECYGNFYTPSQHAMAHEELARIEEAFEKMPEDYRDVICYARILGLSHKEIAELMDRTEGAVRTLLSRALTRLAEVLDDAS